MKNQNFTPITHYLPCIFSCKREVPLVFSSESFTEDSFEICKNIGCPEITINYIQALGR